MIDELILTILKKTKNKQMTKEEYTYISSFLGNINFLVFGTGHDSDLWRLANKNGKTVFLENNPKWITNLTDTFLVNYTTNIKQADHLLSEYKSGNDKNLRILLPKEILNVKWDCIFIDSPEGWNDTTPGRMQSIYMTKLLSNTHTNIFIHDCNRYVEDLYSSTMFSTFIKELTKLRHYKV